MYRVWVAVLISLLGAAVTVPAIAASSSGQFAVKDAGLISCKRFVEEHKKSSKGFHQAIGWIMGYLTGINRFAPDTVDIAPWQSSGVISAYTLNYCRKNGDKRLAAAADRVVAVLRPNRLRGPSKMVKLTNGKKTLYVYEAVLRRAQQMLTERGLFAGAADGTYSAATREAFEKLQAKHKIAVTGLPDQRTLLLLFR